MTAEANVMRIASSTMSEVRMKTWLAASALPEAHHGHAAPGDAAAELEPDERVAPGVDAHLAARLRQEALAGGDHEELHGDDGREPRRGLQHGRPEHRGQREDDGEQRQRDARGQLVADEHRQELVLELRLQHRALGEAGAQLADVRLHRRAAGPWRVGGAGARWCRCRRCIVSLARPPGRCQPEWRRLDARPSRPEVLRQIPKFAFIGRQSGQHGCCRHPSCRRAGPARPCTANLAPLPLC